MSEQNKELPYVINVSRSSVEKDLQKELLDMKGLLTKSMDDTFTAKKSLLLEKSKHNNGLWEQDIIAANDLKELTELEDAIKLVESDKSKRTPKEGGPDDPPRGSLVGLKSGYGGNKTITEYQSYKEMIDSLYDKMESGDKEAEKTIRKMFDKAAPQLKKMSANASISGCPACGSGMNESAGPICKSCGWDASKASPLLELWKGMRS